MPLLYRSGGAAGGGGLDLVHDGATAPGDTSTKPLWRNTSLDPAELQYTNWAGGWTRLGYDQGDGTYDKFKPAGYDKLPNEVNDIEFWWKLNPTSSTPGVALVNLGDASGQGKTVNSAAADNRATVREATINATTQRYLEFDGTDDYYTRGTDDSEFDISLASGFTIVVAYRPVAYGSSRYLLSKYGSAAGPYWGLSFNGSGTASFTVDEGTPLAQAVSTGVPTLGTRNILIARLNTDGSAQLWLRGSVNEAVTSGTSISGDVDSAGPLTVGARVTTGAGNFFNGFLYETAIYSRALTTAELNDLGSPLATKWGLTWAAVS